MKHPFSDFAKAPLIILYPRFLRSLTIHEALVLSYIAFYNQIFEKPYLPISRIQRETNFSRSTIKRSLKKLQQLGLINRTGSLTTINLLQIKKLYFSID